MGKTNSNKVVTDLKDLPTPEQQPSQEKAETKPASKPNTTKAAPKKDEAKQPEGKTVKTAVEDKQPEILKKSGEVAAVPKVEVNLDTDDLANKFAAALKPSLDALPERTANAVTDALSEQLNDISEKLDGVANNAPIHITKEVKVQEDTWGITTKKLPYLFGGGIVGAGIAAAIIMLGGDSN